MNIGVGRTPRSRISRCLLSQKWRDRKGSENRSPLRNHALGRSHRGLRMRCARQHWAFEPTIVLHEKRSRQGGRKRSQESGALANSSCEDHFNLSPQIYSCFTFQPPVPIESTSVQPGALQTRALCARHSLLVLISCRVDSHRHHPVASIGVLSAPLYAYRRAALRETWMHSAEVRSGAITVRFIINTGSAAAPAVACGDTIFLAANGHGDRLTSPLATTFACGEVLCHSARARCCRRHTTQCERDFARCSTSTRC